MRDDLLDAAAAAHWARAHIPVVQDRLIKWHHARPYRLVSEDDPQTGEKLLVAYQEMDFEHVIVADVGAIINSARSSLDLLASALARRNGIKPSPKTHFPIRKWERDFLTLIEHIEKEQWLTSAQITEIKRLRPYKGGDELIWPLHQLDIMRKHERLVQARPVITEFQYFAIVPHGIRVATRLDDKTILARYPRGSRLPITYGNHGITAEIVFYEPEIGLSDEPAIPFMRRFNARVGEVIALFDTT